MSYMTVTFGPLIDRLIHILGKLSLRDIAKQMERLEPVRLSQEASEEAETVKTILSARVSLPNSD